MIYDFGWIFEFGIRHLEFVVLDFGCALFDLRFAFKIRIQELRI